MARSKGVSREVRAELTAGRDIHIQAFVDKTHCSRQSVYTAISTLRKQGMDIRKRKGVNGPVYYLVGAVAGAKAAGNAVEDKPVVLPELGATVTVAGLMLRGDGVEMVLRNGKRSYLVSVKGEA